MRFKYNWLIPLCVHYNIRFYNYCASSFELGLVARVRSELQSANLHGLIGHRPLNGGPSCSGLWGEWSTLYSTRQKNNTGTWSSHQRSRRKCSACARRSGVGGRCQERRLGLRRSARRGTETSAQRASRLWECPARPALPCSHALPCPALHSLPLTLSAGR